MSVFRNNPNGSRPDEKTPAPNRYGDSLLSRPDMPANAMEGVGTPQPVESFPSFGERSPAAPPMMDNRSGPTAAEKCANVIAAGSRWNGSLNIDDSVRIDGQLSGEINAKGTVHISDGARVEAKVRAAFVVVNGSFKGEVRCDERLELMPKSRVEGDIVTKSLNVHEGAIIDGSISMTSTKAQAGRDVESEPAPIRRETRDRAAT
jgi:cytoskeletal protein CcmA (bactofilin family)